MHKYDAAPSEVKTLWNRSEKRVDSRALLW